MNYSLDILNGVPVRRLSVNDINYYCQPIAKLQQRKRLGLSIVEVSDNASMIKVDLKANTLDADLEKSKKELDVITQRYQKAYLRVRGDRISIYIPKEAHARQTLTLKRILESEDYYDFTREHEDAIPIILGETVENEIVIRDLRELIHILIAGYAGSGKSVLLHTIIASLMYRLSPKELQMVLIDLKMVELEFYSRSPYLKSAICREVDQSVRVLEGLCTEMQKRYELFRKKRVRNLARYNRIEGIEKLPYIVVIVDEFADLILASKNTKEKNPEEYIVRLAQKARACGIHLILATQKPTVDICTGLIKANMSTRIALTVSSYNDSMVILDETGAEKLNKKGDMILKTDDGTERLQGAYLAEEEIEAIMEAVIAKYGENDLCDLGRIDKEIDGSETEDTTPAAPLKIRIREGERVGERTALDDDLYYLAVKSIETGKASKNASKKLLGGGDPINYSRLDRLRKYGVIGEYDQERYMCPVYLTIEQFKDRFITVSEANE